MPSAVSMARSAMASIMPRRTRAQHLVMEEGAATATPPPESVDHNKAMRVAEPLNSVNHDNNDDDDELDLAPLSTLVQRPSLHSSSSSSSSSSASATSNAPQPALSFRTPFLWNSSGGVPTPAPLHAESLTSSTSSASPSSPAPTSSPYASSPPSSAPSVPASVSGPIPLSAAGADAAGSSRSGQEVPAQALVPPVPVAGSLVRASSYLSPAAALMALSKDAERTVQAERARPGDTGTKWTADPQSASSEAHRPRKEPSQASPEKLAVAQPKTRALAASSRDNRHHRHAYHRRRHRSVSPSRESKDKDRDRNRRARAAHSPPRSDSPLPPPYSHALPTPQRPHALTPPSAQTPTAALGSPAPSMALPPPHATARPFDGGGGHGLQQSTPPGLPSHYMGPAVPLGETTFAPGLNAFSPRLSSTPFGHLPTSALPPLPPQVPWPQSGVWAGAVLSRSVFNPNVRPPVSFCFTCQAPLGDARAGLPFHTCAVCSTRYHLHCTAMCTRHRCFACSDHVSASQSSELLYTCLLCPRSFCYAHASNARTAFSSLPSINTASPFTAGLLTSMVGQLLRQTESLNFLLRLPHSQLGVCKACSEELEDEDQWRQIQGKRRKKQLDTETDTRRERLQAP